MSKWIENLKELTGKQKATIAFTVLVIGVGVAIISIFFIDNKPKTNHVYNLKPGESKKYSSRTSEDVSSTEESKQPETPQEEAEATLENKTPIEDASRKILIMQSIKSAFDYIRNTSTEELKPSYEHKLSITDPSRINTFKSLLEIGYNVDEASLKIYNSNNTNVNQFIFDMSKPEGNTITIVGNYVAGTEQIELVQIKGIPSGLTF